MKLRELASLADGLLSLFGRSPRQYLKAQLEQVWRVLEAAGYVTKDSIVVPKAKFLRFLETLWTAVAAALRHGGA